MATESSNTAAPDAPTTEAWFQAVREGDTAVLCDMLARGMDVNVKRDSSLGGTALTEALLDMRADAVEEMLERGADPDGAEETALLAALQRKQIAVATFLFDHGADIDVTDNRGRSLLILAAIPGQKEIVEFILSRGADISVRDCFGRTAEETARYCASKMTTTEAIQNLNEVADIIHTTAERREQDARRAEEERQAAERARLHDAVTDQQAQLRRRAAGMKIKIGGGP